MNKLIFPARTSWQLVNAPIHPVITRDCSVINYKAGCIGTKITSNPLISSAVYPVCVISFVTAVESTGNSLRTEGRGHAKWIYTLGRVPRNVGKFCYWKGVFHLCFIGWNSKIGATALPCVTIGEGGGRGGRADTKIDRSMVRWAIKRMCGVHPFFFTFERKME